MNERLRAVVDELSVRPTDRVLEIGCGHGARSLVEPWSAVGGRLLAFYDTPGQPRSSAMLPPPSTTRH